MKQYDKYKDSGVKWIGEIPEEWKIKRIRYSGCFCKGKLPSEINKESIGFPIIGASEILGKKCRFYTKDAHIPMCDFTDILILWDGANAGIVANNCHGVVSSTTVKYSCNDDEIYEQYIYYLFKDAESYFKDKVNGTTIPHMNMKYIDDYPLITPPLPEQRAIATYLDTKCTEIDSLVSLQEEMISELQAYKQSVITEAVTKGIDKNVKYKDSGVEWIGKIPEEWKLVKLKKLFNLSTGTTPNGFDTINEGEETINWFTPSDILDSCNELYKSQRKLAKSIICKNNITLFPKGTLLYVGIGALAGKLGYSNEEGYSNQQITALIPYQGNAKYYFYYLIASKRIIRDNAFFTTLPIINNAYLGQVDIIEPTLEDQRAIAAYLDTKCTEIDSLITVKQQKIGELKEYKKSIIFEYVTGKKAVPTTIENN